MRIARPRLSESVLVWFGVFGAPAAWAAQFVAGVAMTLAQCSTAGEQWQIPIDTLALVTTVAGACVALLAAASALAVFRATRDAPSDPPAGRVHFLATIGITVSPLFLVLILMGGVGAVALDQCQQV